MDSRDTDQNTFLPGRRQLSPRGGCCTWVYVGYWLLAYDLERCHHRSRCTWGTTLGVHHGAQLPYVRDAGGVRHDRDPALGAGLAPAHRTR